MSDYRPWAARWNGSGWTNYVLTAPHGGGLQDAVISGPSTWAVGSQYNANYVSRTLIARWTADSGWVRVPSPNVGSGLPNTGLGNTLTAVTRVPGTGESLWAVGNYGTADQTDEDSRPLILRCC